MNNNRSFPLIFKVKRESLFLIYCYLLLLSYLTGNLHLLVIVIVNYFKIKKSNFLFFNFIIVLIL